MVKDDAPNWEQVHRNTHVATYVITYRMKVPNGWLYRVATGETDVGTVTFVPDKL